MAFFGTPTNWDSRLAVLEDWKRDHDDDCERRYVRIDNKLDRFDQRFEAQSLDFRAALRDSDREKSQSLRGIYALLWSACGALLVMLLVGIATLFLTLLPSIHTLPH
jgi:hypothetical protein